LNEQLKRLGIKSVDFYLLHHLNKLVWPKMRDLGILRWADRAIADGRIGYFGFSFHDNYELFKEIIDSYNWTLCQIQYNFTDEQFQAGTRGLHYAYDKGVAVVVMEPIKVGRLLRPPEGIAKLWEESSKKKTPQEWALRWVWNHPEVAVALSGMSKFEQVKENIGYANQSQPHNLNPRELELIERVRDMYRLMSPISCTGCGYCLPCPNGVDIPRVFEYYCEAVNYSDVTRRRFMYNDPNMIKRQERADKCIKCKKCEEICPQKIHIPEMLEKAHAFLME
jgi:predicted aldo/keto reductase-like oxidoreductase